MPAAASSCASSDGPPLRQSGPVVVVSPHLDDAVFSCGGLLQAHPGSVVITVYTGMPDASDISTDWDRRCGFSNASQAMEHRLAEERLALSLVGSRGKGLGFIDSQYGGGEDEDLPNLAERLLHALSSLAAERVAIPLGLCHGDHVRVSDAALKVREACPGISWFFYEDVPYRYRSGAVQERLAQLRARGIAATPARLETDFSGKAEAVSVYASQLRGLGGSPGDDESSERYWRVAASVRPLA